MDARHAKKPAPERTTVSVVKTDYIRKNSFIIGIYESRAAAWRGSVLTYVTKPRKARNEVDAIRNAFLHVEAEVKDIPILHHIILPLHC